MPASWATFYPYKIQLVSQHNDHEAAAEYAAFLSKCFSFQPLRFSIAYSKHITFILLKNKIKKPHRDDLFFLDSSFEIL